MIGILVVASVLIYFAETSAVPSNKQIRSGRFLAFDSDDAFLDLLDEMQDPLPVPESSSGPIVYEEDEATKESYNPEPKPTKKLSQDKGKIVIYNRNTGKFEVVDGAEGHVALPSKPVTENGLFFFGGQHYQYQNSNGPPSLPSLPPGNKTEEIKIFWSSVGDAIENIPFLPIQVNVPDMLSAMATFLSNSIPLINRIRNPNEPRPISKPVRTESETDFSETYDFPREEFDRIDREEDVEYRRLGTESSLGTKESAKKEVKNTGKGSVKRIFKRPVRPLRPHPTSTEDLVKIWHGSQSGESAKIKNMPITRKKFHVADREFFNFKNSDISNSPIMILNMPSRPMMYYKIKHHHVSEEKDRPTVTARPTEASPQSPRPPQNPTLQISRRRKLRKESKKAAKKATRRPKPDPKKRQ